MLNFKDFLKESAGDGKLKHIHHAEDRPLLHGSEGFEHAEGALHQAHQHMKSGEKSNAMTMKYDGSPAVVYGHHPETGKFFVASKSAFNKNPKINYTEKDIEKNHGHAPGLVSKLKAALKHMPKVAPKKGVYQGDLMHTPEDHKHNEDGSVSFTPNTITYTGHGDDAEKIKKSKVGMVTHTKYEGKSLDDMKATPHVDSDNFKEHSDVHHHTADYDSSKAKYTDEHQKKFHEHMHAAKDIHLKNPDMYKHTDRHQGDGNHLATYINQTVRDGSTPNSRDFAEHIAAKYEKAAAKVKLQKTKDQKIGEGQGQIHHIEKHKEHYDNLLKMHGHLQAAKNTLVDALDSHTGGYGHHINGTETKPEGYVVNHQDQPTKLVNRAEFAKANLLKSRPAPEKHHTIAFGRMNPPTAGHAQVVNSVKETAKKHGGDHTVILSGSHGTKDGKNPLSPEQKEKHAKRAFPNTNIKVADKSAPTIMHQAADLHKKGVTHLHFVGGSDRKEMVDLLKKYNGQEGKHGHYNFKDITYHSSGERDEGSKGTAGISGTKLRDHVANDRKKEFHAALSPHMSDKHKNELWKDLKKAGSK